MFGRKPKTTPLPQVEQHAPEPVEPSRDEVLAEAADELGAVIAKVYDDAYRSAVSDMLATLQERVDELHAALTAQPGDTFAASLLAGLKDAIVTVEDT